MHSDYTVSVCVRWELNPQPFALLTQCSTTEPQEHCTRISCKYSTYYFILEHILHQHVLAWIVSSAQSIVEWFDARTPANFGKSSDYLQVFIASTFENMNYFQCYYSLKLHKTSKSDLISLLLKSFLCSRLCIHKCARKSNVGLCF